MSIAIFNPGIKTIRVDFRFDTPSSIRGRIAEQRTHEELMQNEGIYKSFIAERSKAATWKVAKNPA